MSPDFSLMKRALACRCPRCHAGDLYKGRLSLSLRDGCLACGLDFSKNDSADGPAVFLIFIFGFLLVPLALFVHAALALPLWVHAVLWSVVVVGLTVLSLRPLKSYIMALEFKHRPEGWR